MREKLNPEKSKKLRPLRVILAILIAVLIVLVLDRLPTSVKDRPADQSSEGQQSGQLAPEGMNYYYFHGFLDILDEQLGDRLGQLGVTEEEYKNIAEYLPKKELQELEVKVKLAAELENVYVLSDEANIDRLKLIFELPDNQPFESYARPYATPSEYKDLTDLLAEYDKNINSVEDYDVLDE